MEGASQQHEEDGRGSGLQGRKQSNAMIPPSRDKENARKEMTGRKNMGKPRGGEKS